MRLLLFLLAAIALSGAAKAQTAFVAFQSGTTTQGVTATTTATNTAAATASQATVPATPVIGGFTYQAANPVTYARTATGLLVVLSPAALTGSGPLAGHTEGLVLEIPNSLVNQLF